MKRQMCNDLRLATLLAAGFIVTRKGKAWRIHGYGCDLMVAELRYLDDLDLKPAKHVRAR